MAEADMEAAVVVPMEVEAEAASTVAVEAADSMEAVAEVFTAEAAERIAAAEHRVTLLAAWAPMDAAAEHMAVGVPTVRTAALTVAAAPTERTETGPAEARRRMRGTAVRDRVRGVRIH